MNPHFNEDIPICKDIVLQTKTIDNIASSIANATSKISHLYDDFTTGNSLIEIVLNLSECSKKEVDNTIPDEMDENFVLLPKVSRLLMEEVQPTVEEAIGQVQSGLEQILQSTENAPLKSIISKLQHTRKYFMNEQKIVGNLSADERITMLQQSNGVLNQLNELINLTPNSLQFLLYEIINEANFSTPKNSKDRNAYNGLEALYYGTLSYISAVCFLIDQYAYIAQFYYKKGDMERYNKNFDLVQIIFKTFKYSREGNNTKSLIDNVIDVMDSADDKIAGKDIFKQLSEKLKILTKVRDDLRKIEIPTIVDVPKKISGKPVFKDSVIETPLENWKDGTKVSYAVQYRSNNSYSRVGEWSDPITVRGKACPLITVPVDPKRRRRIVLRKFDGGRPEMVAELGDYETRFRDIDRDLYDAASSGSPEASVLLRNGANVHAVFEGGRSAMHAAAEIGNVQFATQARGSVDVEDGRGYTPLHVAAETGNDEFVQYLIAHNADVNVRTKSGATPLHIASRMGLASTVAVLLKSDAVDMTARDNRGFTPLDDALIGGIPVLKAFISSSKTDVNARFSNGLTLLQLSSMNNYVDLVKLLLENKKTDIDARQERGLAPLHLASIMNNLEVVKVLLAQKGINATPKTASNWTPLHLAVLLKNSHIVSQLLQFDVNTSAKGNVTPLHIAVMTEQKSILIDLLKKGASLETTTEDGLTALHLAAMMGNKEIASILIDTGANIEARTTTGLTPLRLSLTSKNSTPSLIKILINKKSNLSSLDDDNNSLLHYAAGSANLDMVKYLIEEMKLDVKSKNKQGKTPLHMAAKGGNIEVVKYLVDKKYVDIYSTRDDDDTKDVLQMAVESGNLELVKFLIHEAKISNTTSFSGKSLLHIAAACGDLRLVKYLINDEHFDDRRTDSFVATPLHYAAQKGHLNVVKYFVNEKQYYSIDVKGETVLHKAALSGSLDVVRFLLDEKKNNINFKNYAGETILHSAAKGGNVDLIRYLVDDKKLNLSSTSKDGSVALHIAAAAGYLDIIEYILGEKQFDVNTTDLEGETALHIAAANGHLDVVKYLVEKAEADVNAKSKSSFTPLLKAVRGGHQNVAIYLLENKKNNIDGTVLMEAAESANLDLIKYLLDHKRFDVNYRNNIGETVLHKAVQGDDLDVVKYLVVQKKVDFNARDNNGETVVHRSARWSSIGVLKYLIEELGADINAKSNAGLNAVHFAAYDSDLDKLKYLVDEKKLDIHARTNSGRTVLHCAVENKNSLVVPYLVDKKVDLNVKDNNGDTALHIAARNGYGRGDIQYLIRMGSAANIRNNAGQTPANLARDEQTRWYLEMSEDRFRFRRSLVEPQYDDGRNVFSWMVNFCDWVRDSSGRIASQSTITSKLGKLVQSYSDAEKSDRRATGSFVSYENVALVGCIADALDDSASKRYHTMVGQGVEVLPSTGVAVRFALERFRSYVDGKMRDLDSEEKTRIHEELEIAYPEIIASLERGAEFSGNVGLDDVLIKLQKCFCENIL